MLKKYIRMGITIFKFVIWGGISSDIRSEMFYGDASFSTVYPTITSPNDKVEYSYPLNHQKVSTEFFQPGKIAVYCMSVFL